MNTERSRRLFDEAMKVLPGGVSSPVRAIKPYPFYTKKANGSKITDIDGNEYTDYVMGYGPLLLGHNHQAIKEAVIRQLSDLVKAGSGATTLGTPDSAGVPADVTKNTLQVPYNDIEAMTAAIEAYKDDVAAVIIEPVLGNIGPILPKKGYLEDVRKVTDENNVVLIFDEVITGFRLAMGGAQEYYGITPDMTTLGKILGGGFHIGVIGGKKEIMENISPAGPVYQAGTFNGSPVSMTAGLAIISTLKKEKVHEKVNKKGDSMRKALRDVVSDLGLDYSVSGVSSMFKVFFGDMPYDYKDALKCDKEKFNIFFHKMLSDGIFLPPSQYETNFLSLAHSQDDIDKTVEAYRRNLK
ncbi:MAG: aminotransferase class III-fold pyridoxal phosphate-dependent enzyme [Candidatus Methanoperedens sp.]|nr:aminotransferase class III-fold pyridoxal phosphate-dependent enzyme [Candidatus Methanoperedens sp.]